MPNQTPRAAEWKDALFRYVNAMNEAVLSRDSGVLKQIADVGQRDRLAKRMRVTILREKKSGIKPLHSEMRTRIEKQRVNQGEAVVEIALHTVRSFEQSGQPWQEERVDRERVKFVRVGQSWRVDSVLPLVSESHPEVDVVVDPEPRHYREEDPDRRTVIPSLPYMNPNAMYGFKSRVYAGAVAGGDNAYEYAMRGTPYRREAAVAYAERWWNEPNNAYENFDVNCTNYVSQCIFAGGAPMNYTGRRESGWWYKGRQNNLELWSYSWAVANALQHHLTQPRVYGLRAEVVPRADMLQLGDVVCYDWEGNGRFQHNTIVTAFTPEGMPLVNANTVSSRHRYWDYRDSYAWTERTQYRFFHITNDI
ncbi:amidase domain-containing protein [Cohnella yongneupensis]|uniref:Amidase domain-containing protein n=1 Tax=Cohnella yongneupensis TaxID=425006 RepID=A0ABW0QZM7_9BACL